MSAENKDFDWSGWPGFPSTGYEFGSAVTWNEAKFNWDANPYTWDDIRFIILLVQGGGGIHQAANTIHKDKEKRKQFIRIMCKVKGINVYDEEKLVNSDVKITATDINLVIEQLLGMDLTINNINVQTIHG